ncbi:MAG: site-2 protease family protein [Candidatus Bathyarchaeota archaeon]|jgi:Zn-dependent protease|nr:site-2 protease family protein [Candidatus Bathyarchaeota archaeon A05DMB-5]MDH7557724.1 site-2 protease family protein [Candidatus Bathyarchaeota archaeon]
MTEIPNETSEAQFDQAYFEQITALVTAEFQVEEALIEHNVPTYFLKQPQETKNAFLRLLDNLEKMNLIAILRKRDGKIVLKVVRKPPTKPSNILVNWLLFFATIGTTFATGYLISPAMINPLISGATFTVAIMAVLGAHEMGHKLTANKRKVDSSPPYFIPGPPPVGQVFGIGTFGAVIMQKSLPRNRDALFDIGASGPLIGFVITVIVTFVGLALSPVVYRLPEGPFGSFPILFDLIGTALSFLGVYGRGNIILIHPVAFAGFIGMIVTMLNLLPAGMLDGGHVATSILGGKMRGILNVVAIVFLVIYGYYPMAFFVLFLSLFRHPGPLDDVSSLSKTRKYVIPVLFIVFILCGITLPPPQVHSLKVDSNVLGVNFWIQYAESEYFRSSAPWESTLAEGTYFILVNSTITIGGTVYTFLRWEDGSTNLNRTVTLNQDMVVFANYTMSAPLF